MRGPGFLFVPALLSLAACAHGAGPPAGGRVYVPPTGSTEVLREGTAAAPGHELIVADLNLPPDAVGEAHYHPWEEFLYVIAGSAVVDIEGQDVRVLKAGESFVIPPRAVHTPRAGPTGVRAIVMRVHDAGDPMTIPAR